MTRRDYVLLSAALRQARDFARCQYPRDETPGVDIAAREMARVLASHNPRFDQPRFLRDAGVVS